MMFKKVLLGGLVITLVTWISDHLVVLLDVSVQAGIRHSHEITSKIGNASASDVDPVGSSFFWVRGSGFRGIK